MRKRLSLFSPLLWKLRGFAQRSVYPALPAAAAAAEMRQDVRVEAETDGVFGTFRFRPPARAVRQGFATPVPDTTAKIVIGQLRDFVGIIPVRDGSVSFL
jgi:hypothetical protein